jgi:hypothetical protein
MENLIAGARLWYDAGYIVVPTHQDKSKRPYSFWKNYQDVSNRPDFEHIERLIRQTNSGGIGVITGKASGNVEMIELEGRAVTPETMDKLAAAANAVGLGDLWLRLQTGCVEQSPSGGIHFFVRVTDGEVDGNTPLAERPNPDNPALVERLAETRGEGGFVVVAPSEPRSGHDSGYKFIKSVDGDCTPNRTPLMTKAEVKELHRIFGMLDERIHTVEQTPVQIDGTRPGDDFANQTEWAEILEPQGWVKVYDMRGNTYWRRPGKSEGVSASTKDNWFYVFTTSTTFEANRAYTKFYTYAHLNHGGDTTAAAKDLRSKGYGKSNDFTYTKPTNIEAGTTATANGRRTVIATPVSQIKVLPTDWLLEGRMALGAFNLLAGREGLGKSTVGYQIAADVTNGALDGFYKGKPKSVMIAGTEDSFAKTIVPRLIAAQANLDRIFRIDVADEDGVMGNLILPKDTENLKEAILQHDVALIILDPLMSRVESGIDTHKDSDVRKVLEPITRICEETNACLLGVIHHNKTMQDDPNSAVMGSRAFAAVARAIHSVVADPEDEVGARRIFETTKNNLGRLDLPALTFTIESFSIPTELGRDAVGGRLVWGEDSTIRARDAMRMSGKPPTKKQQAKQWLRDLITDYQEKNAGEWMRIDDIEAAAEGEDFSWATVREAAKLLGLNGASGPRSGRWGF